jgi:hypothetical protein
LRASACRHRSVFCSWGQAAAVPLHPKSRGGRFGSFSVGRSVPVCQTVAHRAAAAAVGGSVASSRNQNHLQSLSHVRICFPRPVRSDHPTVDPRFKHIGSDAKCIIWHSVHGSHGEALSGTVGTEDTQQSDPSRKVKQAHLQDMPARHVTTGIPTISRT